MVANIIKKNIKYLLLLFFLIFFLLLYISFYIQDLNNTVQTNNLVKKCNKLNYLDSLELKPDKFKSFNLELKIDNNRKWQKILAKNQLSFFKESHYQNKGKINANLIISFNKIKCFLNAEIKPHGDFPKHHANFYLIDNKPVYQGKYKIPSLSVDLVDGHFFGITKFILFKPRSRNYDNEILTATILNEVGLLSPRTTWISLNYQNENFTFIFQEKINKEFLEYNNKIEGPIYKGDERFSFKYWYLKNEFSQHRLSNGKWAMKNKNNFIVSKKALKILNFVGHFNKSNVKTQLIVDYFGITKNFDDLNYFNQLPTFDSLMYAMGSVHNLSRDDRRFYFNVVTNSFEAIYYDGTPRIVDNKLNITEEFKNISNNWYYSLLDTEDSSENKELQNHITLSSKYGSLDAIKLIKKINIDSLHNKLKNYKVNISHQVLKEILLLIMNNLNIISTYDENKIINSKLIFNKSLANDEFYKNIKANYIFENNDKLAFDEYEVCNLLMEKCKIIDLNLYDQRKMLEQELKLEDKTDLIFIGNQKDYFNKILSVTKIKSKKILLENHTTLTYFGEIKVDIDYNKRTILVNRNNNHDKLLIENGILNNWTIKLNDFTKDIQEANLFRDINGLTGCLNIFDLKLLNIKIEINGSSCEDAVNLVRTSGQIEKITIDNSQSDGVDSDFSDLKIKYVKITNSKGDCLDLSKGNYNIDLAILSDCKDKAISAGEISNLFADKINITKSYYGLVAKDYSDVKVNDLTILESENCLSVYSKKQEFSGASILINNFRCEPLNLKNKNIYSDELSKIKINTAI